MLHAGSLRLFVLDWTVTISVTVAVTDTAVTDTREEAGGESWRSDDSEHSRYQHIGWWWQWGG